MLVYCNFISDQTKETYTTNTEMVRWGMFWYFVSLIGFLNSCIYHIVCFDDLFMLGNALSFFYTWQTYEPTVFSYWQACTEVLQWR